MLLGPPFPGAVGIEIQEASGNRWWACLTMPEAICLNWQPNHNWRRRKPFFLEDNGLLTGEALPKGGR